MSIADSAVIPYAKIANYLLDVQHPTGASKARSFIGQAFSPERPEELADALHAHFADPQTFRKAERHPRGFGMVIEARGPMSTPAGRIVSILSVWNRRSDGDPSIFVTAYPDQSAGPRR